jgi:hypothetical protein
VEQHHRRAIDWTGVDIPDVENAGLDLDDRAE